MYPEHEKMDVFNYDEITAIFEFIEYLDGHYEILDENGKYFLGKSVFYNMLGIDSERLTQEQKEIASYLSESV